MEIRVTIDHQGRTAIESISLLEDFWHDYTYFKSRASAFRETGTPTDHFLAKRYRRAALLTLFCYFEGVINHWLKEILPPADWSRVNKSREPLHKKLERIQEFLASTVVSTPDLRDAKELRNDLAHFKPGLDGKVYDKVSHEMVEETESCLTQWLRTAGEQLDLRCHPDSRQESERLLNALGTPVAGSEGYTNEGE